MRFVTIKSVEQQAALSVHRLRQGLVEERTALINRLRGLLTEFGVVAALSPEKLRQELRHCLDEEKTNLPHTLRQLVRDELAALDTLEERIDAYAAQIAAQARENVGHNGCNVLPGSARSPLRRWWRRSDSRRSFAMAVSSRRGWDWCRGSTAPAARRAWDASPGAAMRIYAHY